MATFNLVRNSRVFFTTNVDASTGAVVTTGSNILSTTTYELQVLDGFSFSQATNADTITISEAGTTPVRGQRSFNTSLNNVEFSFSTYLRPYLSTTVKGEEHVLWNALLSSDAVAAASVTPFTYTSLTSATLSNPTPTTNKLAIIGVGMLTFTVGTYYVLRGIVAVGANQYNSAVKILSSTATLLELEYVVAPTAAAASANWGTTGTVSFSKQAWNEHTAVGADTGIVTAYSSITSALSNKNQLQKFGMYFVVDGVMYVVDNCAMDQAVIDFGLDGIAMVAWTGKGTAIRQLPSTAVVSAANPGVFSGAGNATGTAAAKVTTASYITNKLSTVALTSNIGGVSGTAYTLALTGGSVTIANGITYVTPANLGVVNVPVGYFTGTRSVTGSLTAYLRTGTAGTAALLNSMLANASTSVDPKFKLQLDIGGIINTTRAEVLLDAAMLQIPTIDAQAVMSTTINFTAQGSESVFTGGTAGYDIENTNDVRIRYFAA